MLYPVNKKRLQQAIDAYNELESFREAGNRDINGAVYNELWNVFYQRACHCCEGGYNNNLPSLIYNTPAKRRTVENIYYAILILGYNDTYGYVGGDEYYESV